MKKHSLEPYRVLFPLGICLGLVGVLVWPLFAQGLLTSYPIAIHRDLMVGGFLFSFISGFLMTAIPRFTGAALASPREIFTSLILCCGLGAAGWLTPGAGFHLLALAAMIWLGWFAATRVRDRANELPRFFLFVGVGLGAGIVGSLFLFLEDVGLGSWIPAGLGANLFYQGMTLALVLGVGGKLLPSLFGWSAPPLAGIGKRAPSNDLGRGTIAIMALALLASYVAEPYSPVVARVARALLITAVAVRVWRLHHRPKAKTSLALWLWISAWCLAVGFWIYACFPAWAIHAIHLAYIGGFSLMTLMIASRVTLAHGGYSLETEKKLYAFRWTGALFVLAALTRAAAPFYLASYVPHLMYVAVIWILGVMAWAVYFLPRQLDIKIS